MRVPVLKTSMILARTLNNVIGVDGRLPWKSMPEDMEIFKAVTSRPNILLAMGMKTWLSLPKRPLKGRHQIVITSNNSGFWGGTSEWDKSDCEGTRVIQTDSVEHVMSIAKANGYDEVIFIGGSTIYQQVESFVDEVHLTVVNDYYEYIDREDVVFYDKPFISSPNWFNTWNIYEHRLVGYAEGEQYTGHGSPLVKFNYYHLKRV